MYQPLINFLQLFKNIPQQDEVAISNAVTFKKVKAGEVLLETGTTATEFFFIAKGNDGKLLIATFYNIS